MSQLPLTDVESSTTKPSQPPHLTSHTPNAAPENITKTGSNIDPQLAGERELSERNLAQEAALRRLNGLGSQPKRDQKAPDSGSIASTQPVLVREYSQPSPSSTGMKQSKMRQKRNSTKNGDSSEMPSLESFSFQDILASIDPEIHGSIDKIAEICGRSRMSLADEYSSHLPPQGDFPMPSLQDHVDQVPVSRLEPVEEASSTHEESTSDSRSARVRAARLSLVGSPVREHGELSSAPVIATSTIASHTQSSALREGAEGSETQSSYVPQLLAWLRGSRDDPPRSSYLSRRDSGAANALQRILGSSADRTTN
ncbi:MAG: hypothetical protein Q9225_003656 [Loekoesia sp. 1 TL-2023]